jgi:pimeloyl-ACP methyl ester carboxylesterase
MALRSVRFLFLAFVPLIATTGSAQPAAAQDPALDNLVHPKDYVTAPLATLGAVVERGEGRTDVVLVSGFGLGASAFEGFLRRNDDRFHMLAVTLPGFEGTAAPPMPASGISYGEQTWTRAAAQAVAALIRDRKLERPVLVGHSLNGPQVVLRVAIEHAELVRAVVFLAGSARYEPVEAGGSWPKNLTLEKKVQMADQFMAPRWFKTVTRETWVKNNFKADDYSIVPERGARFANLANAAPLPVLVRWLCEFHASDLLADLPKLQRPFLVVEPTFTETLRADPARSYLQAFFVEPWRAALSGRPRTETLAVDAAGILVMDDQPELVDRKFAEFVESAGK